MKRSHLLSALAPLFVVLALAGCSSSGGGLLGGKSQEPVELKLTGKVGDVWKTRMSMNVTIDPKSVEEASKTNPQIAAMVQGEQKLSLVTDNTSTVTAVKDGKITSEETVDNAQVKGTGMFAMMEQMASSMKGQKQTLVRDAQGKVIDRKGASANSTVASLDMANGSFPNKPVKEGDSWDTTTTQNGQTVSMTFTVERVDAQTVTLNMTAKPGQPVITEKPVKMVFDRATGQMVSMDGSITGEQQGLKMKIDLKVEKR